MKPTPFSRLYNFVTSLLFSCSLTASLLSLSLSLMTMIAYLFWATLAYNCVKQYWWLLPLHHNQLLSDEKYERRRLTITSLYKLSQIKINTT